MKIAYFVTPHGFGHAARATAVMQALRKRDPDVGLTIYTTVPEWFFRESLADFRYRQVETDLGFVQNGPFDEDPVKTCEKLGTMLPFPAETIDRLAGEIGGCDYVICDIAALGIAVARKAGVPSVLVENFTWDWMYREYLADYPGFRESIDYFEALYRSADIHIQTEPVCAISRPHLMTNPVCRELRLSREEIREKLHVDEDTPLVLVSTGGVPTDYPFLDRLMDFQDIRFVIPVGGRDTTDGNLCLLSRNSGHYHPDLTRACDAVVCKAGYSTIAESYHAGVPVGYFLRDQSPESPALEKFLRNHMRSLHLKSDGWEAGDWVEKVLEIVQLGRVNRTVPNGAAQIAGYLHDSMFC